MIVLAGLALILFGLGLSFIWAVLIGFIICMVVAPKLMN